MILRHVLSILILPVTVTLIIPYWIAGTGGAMSEPWLLPAPIRIAILLAGALAITLGLTLVVITIRHFATIGRGTLAPWDPTRSLVVHGVYRHVRNPMISGIVLILLGEALILSSTALLLWAFTAFAINAVYIPLVEEPGLRHRFGAPYEEYCRYVPRWIPRRTPWPVQGTTSFAHRDTESTGPQE